MISILCPTLNEELYIEKILSFFLNIDISEKELFVIDGGSVDNTLDIIKQYSKYNKEIYLLQNVNKYVPYALNIAIPKCKGDIIIRLDAHTEYDPNYVQRIIETFNKTDSSIVGGPMRAIGKTDIQTSIAYCTSTFFGIGNSNFHNENYEGYSDSVYLGAWKKEIFDKTGLFDVEMLRNQDDEFHYRARSKGYKIYLNPEIKSFYYPRDTLKKVFSQYYQYGLFKPLVLKKVKSGFSWRHIVPSLFVLYLLMLLFVFLFPLLYQLVVFLPMIIYIYANFYYAFNNKLTIKQKIFTLITYPVLHISYGLGFIIGLKNIFNGKRN